MTSVDTAVVVGQMESIEAEVHKRGWDKEPELHVLYKGADGSPQSHLAVRKWPDGGGHGDRLVMLADSFEHQQDTPLGRLMLRRIHEPTCYALAFVSEAYINLADDGGMTPEQMREYAAGRGGPLRLADRPGSLEARVVGGRDLDGNVYLYRRIRGRAPNPVNIFAPEAVRSAGDGADMGSIASGLVGKIPDALARLLRLIRGEQEPGTLPEWLRGKS